VRSVVVVSRPDDWPLSIPGVEVVLARDYLTQGDWTKERGLRAFNLCRSYRYQSEGYYVSLLGAARRHRPFPDLMTVLDMKSRARIRTIGEDLDRVIQKQLANIRSKRFELSIYFGRNLAARYDRLARLLFTELPAPLLRASFTRNGAWRLTSVAPIPLRDVPDSHRAFLHTAAEEYFGRSRYRTPSRRKSRFDLAILHDPEEVLAPSDEKALGRFRRAAQEVGFGVEMIQRDDYARLPEFDALFIRETTYVNHHTFRFAQRAEAEGLVVVDDPQSILRCTNKVFQTEAFEQAGVPIPRTLITDRLDPDEIESRIGFPCVLKLPDSSFSQGVVKCADPGELEEKGAKILDESDLLLVQEFTPSEFDWRIGVFDGSPLYACQYRMARGHWQIVKQTGEGGYRFGGVTAVPLDDVPPRVLDIAVRAAATMGNGLYGVDLKQAGRRVVVMEVNDNPNIDGGCEDAILKKELYLRIMRGFLERVEERKRGTAR